MPGEKRDQHPAGFDFGNQDCSHHRRERRRTGCAIDPRGVWSSATVKCCLCDAAARLINYDLLDAHSDRATKVLSGEQADRTATTGTGTCGAAKAVVTSHDLTIFERIRIDIPKKKRLVPSIAGPLHSELLIKIAIVHSAAPADADRIAAHQSVDGRWIKRVNEQLHVFLQLAVMPQIACKAANWKICERVKLIKHNSKMFFEFAFVISLKLVLRRRQKWSDWIVNKMQRQFGIESVA